MVKNLYYLILLLVLFGCAHTSQNLVSKGDYVLKGGSYKSVQWTDGLEFKRISWYLELSLVYDAFISRVDRNSKFYNWFSDSEKEYMDSCDQSYVAMVYSMDSKKISHSKFKTELEKSGLTNFTVNEFHNYLKVHKDYDKLNLKLYKVEGFCLKHGPENENGQRIDVGLPGYTTLNILN